MSTEPQPAVLILHGFTGYLSTVAALSHEAQRLGLAWRMPVLRGHGTRPEDLVGVTWRDWYADAEAALLELSEGGRPVLCLGLSMGSLLALDLAGTHPDRVCGVAAIAPAIELASPLLPLLPLLAPFMPWVGGAPGAGQVPPERQDTYPRFPTCALRSLCEYSQRMRTRLDLVRADTLVVMSRADKAVRPRGAERIYHGVAARNRELVWYERHPHDMLLGEPGLEVAARVGLWMQQQAGG